MADDEHREGTGEGPGPQSQPDEAGPPLTEEDGTTAGASEGTQPHEPEPGAGGGDAVPRREQGGL